MDGKAQPAATHISAIDTPLDHSQDKAMPLVEWALTPMGHSWSKEEYASLINYPSGQSLLCDRRHLGAAAKAYKELFRLPKRGRNTLYKSSMP